MKNTSLILTLFILFIGSYSYSYAQDEIQDILIAEDMDMPGLADSDSLQISSVDKNKAIDPNAFYVPQSWEVNLEQMMNSWYTKNYTKQVEHKAYSENVPANDSIYVDRLSKLNCIIELPYNDIVRNCINLYVNKRRSSVETMLGLQHIYFPMIEQALDENGLPDELKYMAVIESALNPMAVSRVGATGMWQFMLKTGKQYGLEINSLVDERRDPYKATYAACEYMKDMYKIFGDWTLCIAAYNCGAWNVQKAIKRAGDDTDFWAIYPFLPKETRTYVPLFIAANYVMNYYPHHQLYPAQTSLPLATDTLIVEKQVHFEQMADLLDVDIETLRALNPQYKQDIVPGNSSTPRCLRMPILQSLAFIEKQDTIAKHRVEELFPNRAYAGNYSGANQEQISHKVRNGENLSTIASRYGVSTSDLRKWNGLKTNNIIAGKNLVVYSNKKSSQTTKQIASKPAASSSNKTASKTKNYSTYKVKQGETLSTIAQRYRGYSYKDIMRLNGMKNTKLRAGQVIKVPKV
ncbi:LysM peptidoglycan-binding domain-containing protein [Bacteroidales bacterium OttesenSCG-928-I14]|nr:LysM peptidoglycan-binding domain-containing protein [Bacteroidales bacterium OttesenSCG-928-I14]